MKKEFPEITSFGTLFAFAQAFEESLVAMSEEVIGRGGEKADAASRAHKRHSKRLGQLERLRRERLNEVVLQPLSGMERERYVPDLSCPGEASGAAAALAAAEEKAALFLDEAAEKAGSVLGGVERTLRKLAAESRELAASLR